MRCLQKAERKGEKDMEALLGNAVVLAALCAAIALAVRSLIKKRKQGGCGCGCSGCPKAAATGKRKSCGESGEENWENHSK